MKRLSKRAVRPGLPALLFSVALQLMGGPQPQELRAQTAAPAALATAGVRTLYLVRHGAYDIEDPRDEAVGRGLLPLGVAQARLVGDRLRGLPFTFDAIFASPLTRARETAEGIAVELRGVGPSAPAIAIDPDLAECTPPTRRADIMAQEKLEDLAACSAQLERLAARLFAPPAAGSVDRRELVVAHGNVIRWLVTRALAVDPAAWLGMSIGHASITVLAIDGKGVVRVIAVGDVGHLSPGLQTGSFGDRESWDLAVPTRAPKPTDPAPPTLPAAPLVPVPLTATPGPPIVLMISFDGFRWDYPELHGAPTLLELAREGVRAESLVPSFPSKTYPNHYTLVTGLRPEHHGIVANSMWDPEWKATFSLADRSTVEDGRWWEGEPIWVGAERRGLVTASSFWPGSESAVGGVRPTYWKRFDSTVSDEARVDEVLGWLDLAPEKRPRLITLYFDEPDRSGHAFGPASREAQA
ncbi:MAG: alkaline phosphatase family protein, partial [Thermoanaerobaculia bacterium]